MKNHIPKLIIFLAAFIAGTVVVVFFWQSRPSPTETQTQTNTPNNETVQPASPQQITEPPTNELSNSAIGKVDFGNFKYPSLWTGVKTPVKLEDGELVFEEDRCHTKISLDKVKYLDLTNDGEDDALVILHDITYCGSSWRAVSFLVFTMLNKKPQMIWKFTTGSEAHGGMRDFWLDGKELIVELYGKCKIVGFEPKVDYSEIGKLWQHTDWALKSTTKFRFGWNGHKFGQKSVEVLPYPYESTFDDKDEKHYR